MDKIRKRNEKIVQFKSLSYAAAVAVVIIIDTSLQWKNIKYTKKCLWFTFITVK